MAKVQMCVTENVKEPSLYVAIDTVGLIKVSELSYLRQTWLQYALTLSSFFTRHLDVNTIYYKLYLTENP